MTENSEGRYVTAQELAEIRQRIEVLEKQHVEDVRNQKSVYQELKRLREELETVKGKPVARAEMRRQSVSAMKENVADKRKAKTIPVPTPVYNEIDQRIVNTEQTAKTKQFASTQEAVSIDQTVWERPPVIEAESEPIIAEQQNAVNRANATVAQGRNKKKKDFENKFGKNFMGIIASILIIVSIISFGSLIYRYLTDVVKISIMYTISIALTVLGTYMIVKKNRSKLIFSAVAACGTVGIYVTALIGCFGFDLYPKVVLLIIIAIWLVCVCIASKVASRMFLYIFNVGLIISVFLDASKSSNFLWDVAGYFVGITVLYIVHRSSQFKKDLMFFLQIPVITIIFYLNNACNFPTRVLMCALNLLVIIVCNLLYDLEYLSDAEGKVARILWYVSTVFSYGAALMLAYVARAEIVKILFMAVSIAICVMYHFKYSKRDRVTHLMMFYLTMSSVLLFIGTSLIGDYAGYIVPAIALLAIGLSLDNRHYKYTGYAFLFLFTFMRPEKIAIWVSIVLVLVIAALLSYFLFRKYSVAEKMILSVLIFINVLKVGTIDSDVLMHIVLPVFVILIGIPMYAVNFETKEKEILSGVFAKIISMAFLIYASSRIILLGSDFVQISVKYITCLYVLFGVFLAEQIVTLFLKKDAHTKYCGYFVATMMMLFCLAGDGNTIYGIVAVAILLISMTVYLIKDYHQTDKCILAVLYLLMIIGLERVFCPDLRTEWVIIVLSIVVILYNTPFFTKNIITGEQEKATKSFGHVMNVIFMVITSIGVFGSKSMIEHHTHGALPYIFVSVMIALYILNTKYVYITSMKKNERRKGAGNAGLLYICMKLLIMLLLTLNVFSAATYVMSICVLIFAIGCIAAGFRLQAKPFRIYGLIITLICVVKIVLFDIEYSSSIMLPLGLFITGILCFVISWGYAKLEKQNAEEISAEEMIAEEMSAEEK